MTKSIFLVLDRDVSEGFSKLLLCGKSTTDCLVNTVGADKRFCLKTLSKSGVVGAISESQVNLGLAAVGIESDELPVVLVVVFDLMFAKQLLDNLVAGEEAIKSPVRNTDLDALLAE